MNKTSRIALISAFLVIPFSGVQAHTSGFVTDSDGKIVTDGYGECVSFGKLKHGHKHKHGPDCAAKPAKKVAKKPAPAPKPAPKPVVENITLGAHALFDTNKSDLRAEGIAQLDDAAAKLKSFSSINSISVTGHTDSRGSENYNQGLSERRAAAVKTYLMNKGIDGSKISSSGQGETNPTDTNKTKEGRQANRRVEISISATK